MAREARYLDLVRVARRLDEENRARASDGCLLAHEGPQGYALRADVQVAVRPLPSPPDALRERLRSSDTFRVLTRWGSMGASKASLALVTFTDLAPRAVAGDLRLLAGTADGWLLHEPSGAATGASLRGPAPVGRVVAWLADMADPNETTLLVTAEAEVKLARVHDMLSRIPARLEHVVLASVLPPGTHLPEAEAKPAPLQRCARGLPPLPADADLGELGAQRLLDTMQKLQPRARRCLTRARGGQAAGALLRIAFRIGPSGTVTEACLQGSEPEAPDLARCVLDALRELRMPTPQPAGYVDVQVPLNVRPARTAPPEPTCE